MAGIEFENYIIPKMCLRDNENFNIKSLASMDVTTEFEGLILISEENAQVTLSTQCGSLENTESPFQLNVEIVGSFQYKVDESEGVSFENYLKTNAITLLFPYLRSICSDLVLRTNNYPNFILPVINVPKMLEKNNKIKIVYTTD